MSAFEARTSRWKVGLLLVCALVFIAIGILLAFEDLVSGTIAGILIVVFGALFTVVMRSLVQQNVQLRINERGVYWRRRSDETVPWAAIRQITLSETLGSSLVCLFLRDPAAYPPTTIHGKITAPNWRLAFADIALTTSGTDRSFTDLQAAIERFAPPDLRR